MGAETMPIVPAQAEAVAYLTRLAGRPPIETHISYVFVGTDTVWKLKKAVRLSFVDFTRVADRRRFAERELELNAPAAPGLYRDVVPLCRRADGSLRLGEPGGDGEACDWVLRMAPVPPEDFLDAIAAADRLTPALVDALADGVAAYHQMLPPLRDRLPAMHQILLGNVPSALAAGLPAEAVYAWRDACLAALEAIAPWAAERASDGFVRRGHGDLHLGNLCIWQERPVPFDALEFDETLATIDVAYDLAFLLMDLDHRVNRAAANRVLNRYVARTGDAGLVCGLPVFMSVRAMVRAHVEARSGHPRPVWQRYLDGAVAYLHPATPAVVAIGGLPGSGKSTLARMLAPLLGRAPGALVLRSDEIRKRQHGVAPEHRLCNAAYTEAASVAVFAALSEDVRRAASGGQSVVADATFINPAHRDAVAATARAVGVPFYGYWLDAPLEELERRIAGRSSDASDATIAVLRNAAAADRGALDWRVVPGDDMTRALAFVGDTLRRDGIAVGSG